MTTLEEFLRAPSEELLERCWREQLVKIAEHFKMDVGDRWLKENVKNILKENLLEAVVLQLKLGDSGAGLHMADVSVSEVELSIGLTFQQRKELLLQVEIKKLEPLGAFDVAMSLRLVPQFCESDPDTFFLLFERVAEIRVWSDVERTLLLQCVLTGKAQEA